MISFFQSCTCINQNPNVSMRPKYVLITCLQSLCPFKISLFLFHCQLAQSRLIYNSPAQHSPLLIIMESRGKQGALQAASKEIHLFITVCANPQNTLQPLSTARTGEHQDLNTSIAHGTGSFSIFKFFFSQSFGFSQALVHCPSSGLHGCPFKEHPHVCCND